MSARTRRKGHRPRPAASAAVAARHDAEPRAAGWKAPLALALVALTALWPLVHRALVAVYDVNPWKLAGWALYTPPTPPLLIGLFGERGGRLAQLDPATLPVDAQLLLHDFERDRHALGGLRSPDDVAARVLAARADLDRVVVVVQRLVLDPDSALMTASLEQYPYARGQTRTSASTPK